MGRSLCQCQLLLCGLRATNGQICSDVMYVRHRPTNLVLCVAFYQGSWINGSVLQASSVIDATSPRILHEGSGAHAKPHPWNSKVLSHAGAGTSIHFFQGNVLQVGCWRVHDLFCFMQNEERLNK